MCVLTIARNIPSLVCPYKRIDHEFIAGLFQMDILYTPWGMRIARGKYANRFSRHSSPQNFANKYTQRHERKHWFCYTCPWENMSTLRFNHIPLNCWGLGHLGTLHMLTGTCVRWGLYTCLLELVCAMSQKTTSARLSRCILCMNTYTRPK